MSFNSFEQNAIRSLDNRNPGQHPVVKEMHPKAKEVLQKDAIDPRSFIDLYGTNNVENDLLEVEKTKQNFETDPEQEDIKKTAELLEAILYIHTELSDWLGPNASTIRTSEYDDIKNGVDMIVEFDEHTSPHHLAFAVDITFGSKSMSKKFMRIKEEIDADKLALVKYYESHGFKGSLKQVPRIVIGIEKDRIIELASLWMRGKNRELGEHFVKDIIFKEITLQINAFYLYAQRQGKDGAMRSYLRALQTLKLLATNRQTTKFPADYAGDRVLTSIEAEVTQNFG